MKFFIAARPGAKAERVERLDETHFKIWVKAPPAEGRANKAVVKALAVFLGVPGSSLELISGHTSKNKVVELRS